MPDATACHLIANDCIRSLLSTRLNMFRVQPHGFVSEHRLAIYSVSHAPASLRLNLFGCPEHPDPEGANLVAFADAILDLQEKRRRGVWGHDQVPLDGFGVFWPFCSLLQVRVLSMATPCHE